MKRCFGLNYVNYSGEELEKALGKGMPDYYLRYRNRVFGCKDVQIAAKKKLSSDYKTIKNNFWEVCHKFQGACNSYIEYKEEFELNQVFPFNKYIFQEARKVGYELKRFVGLMKFLRIWRSWIGKGSDEWDWFKERIWSTTLFCNLSYTCD